MSLLTDKRLARTSAPALHALPGVAPALPAAPAVPADPAGRLVYLDHFGLRAAPFQMAPLASCFFGGAERGHMLYALLYCLRRGEDLVTLAGEAGVGKTLLARMLQSCAPSTMDIVFVANPSLARPQLVARLADELGVTIEGPPGPPQRRALLRAVRAHRAAGRQIVLIVDGVHAAAQPVLDELCLLLEPDRATGAVLPLAVLLIAQEEAGGLLEVPLAARSGRLTQRFYLGTLDEAEVIEYLDFRTERAGGRPAMFDAAAARMIAQGSMGLIARVNVLADRALMAAYCERSGQVQRGHVEIALNDSAFRARRAGVEGAGGREHPDPAGADVGTSALGRLWRRYGLGRIGPD